MENFIKEKQKNDFLVGKKSEENFINAVRKCGYKTFSYSKYVDYKYHIDVGIQKDYNILHVDVKGVKEGFDEGWTWIELKNVEGKTGWLYAKYMSHIAFDMGDYYLLVDRYKLLDIVEKNRNIAITEDDGDYLYYEKQNLKYYRRYRRLSSSTKDRILKDEIIKVPFNDVVEAVVEKFIK